MNDLYTHNYMSEMSLLYNSIDNLIRNIKENINGENQQISAVQEVADKIIETCKGCYSANANDFESFYYGEYKKINQLRYGECNDETNRDIALIHNDNKFHQVLKRTSDINTCISTIYCKLVEKMLTMLEDESDLDRKAETIIQTAITTIQQNPCDYVLKTYSISGVFQEIRQIKAGVEKDKSEMIETCNNLLKYLERKRIASAKRRTVEYWKVHLSEKVELESEKKSLIEQIAALNKEIPAIPQKTNGYAVMVKLQNKIEQLDTEKKSLGIFKFKEKKAVQEQIDLTNDRIAPINARINRAIEEVNKRISSLKSRIDAIDTELTKPR